MGIDLNAIRNRLKSLQTTTSKGKYLWKPEPGSTKIRIVPYAFNKDNPFIELFFHYNVGKKSYLSLETFNEADPIVEFSEQLKQTGSKEDWILGRKLEPTLRTFVPVIVRGKEKEGVKFWGFGKNIYQELLAIIADPDYGDMTDPTPGRDIEITYQTPQEAGNTYGKTSLLVKPNQLPCTEDKEVLELIVNGQTDILEVYKRSSYDELKIALAAWLDPEADEAITDTANAHAAANAQEAGNTQGQPQSETKQSENTQATPQSATKVDDVTKAFDKLFNQPKKD